MSLNVSIVTYHTDSEELLRCLHSLQNDVVSTIFIVDNSSQGRIRDLVSGMDKVRYIASENVGYGSAHNVVLQESLASGTDYHLVLNSDVRFEPKVLQRLVEVMSLRPEVGQLQPRVVYPDGELQYTVRRLPCPLDVFGRRFLPDWMIRKRDDRYLLKHIDHSKEFNVPYHQGSFMLLRVAALRTVGLFDERFFMYPEDIDLTRRVHRHYVTLYYPQEEIIHDHRRESYKSWRMLRIHIVNMIRYFNKWGWVFDGERRRFNRKLS